MIDLTPKSPCHGLLPLNIADVSVSEEQPGAMTLIAPLKGRDKELSRVMQSAHGMAMPGPGRSTGKAGARAIWFSQGQVMLIGPKPDAALSECATLSDQSDGWAIVRLDGAAAGDVLARLTPLDLRASVFKRGHCARTYCAHMMASLAKIGDKSFQIMVFRSMAQTLVHELKTAMEGVAARG